MNSAILDQLEDAAQTAQIKIAAEREKALAVYWSILADSNRTTPDDKTAMAAAMKTLGKTLEDADLDTNVAIGLRMLPELSRASLKAQDAYWAAQRQLRQAQEERPALILKAYQPAKDAMAAAREAERNSDGAAASWQDKRAFLDANQRIVDEAKRFIKVED